MQKSVLFQLANVLFVLASAVFLFFFLTNAIPLMELGWIEDMGTGKKAYAKTGKLTVALFAGFITALYWLFRKDYEDFIVVRGVRWVLNQPLWSRLVVLYILYVTVMAMVGFTRYAALESRGFDLGIFAQAVWNTLQGDFLYSSIKGGICLMGDHVSPFLALLTPFYAVWQDPRCLILLQALAAGSCMFLIAKIAQEKFNDSTVAFVFALMYFFFFPTRAALHEDFHPEVLVEPFMLLAFIFIERKKIIAWIACLLVVVSAKENMFGIAFMFGFYAFVVKKMRWIGLLVMIVSVATMIFAIQWVVPYFSGKPYLYGGFYKSFVTGEGGGILARILDGDSWEYFFKIFLPFVYTPFFHPGTLMLTAPVLMQNILSENEVARSFNYHYTTGLTPFVFIASIYGFNAICQRFTWVRGKQLCLIGVLLVVSLLRSGASEYYYYWQSNRNIDTHTQLIHQKLREIPAEDSVITHNNLVPQLAQRKHVHLFDYNSLPTKLQRAAEFDATYVIFDQRYWERGTRPLQQELSDLTSAGYVERFAKDGFYILKKG